MTRYEFFGKLLNKLDLPFNVEDVTEVDGALITLKNDEHPYIIRIEKLPIESDYDDEQKVNILSGTKNNNL